MSRFRPGDAATLPSLSPGLFTIFVDVERLLVGVSKVPCPTRRADAVLVEKRKAPGTYQQDKTVPDSKFTYERLPREYEELPFPQERILRRERPLYIFFRQYLLEFLEELNSTGLCQVVAFTSSVKERTDAIIDCIEGVGEAEGPRKLFQGRLYREHCCWVPRPSGSTAKRYLQPDLIAAAAAAPCRMMFVKDLRVVTPFVDPKRCIIIDNNAAGCAAHLKNGICLGQNFELDDYVLDSLKRILLQYMGHEDVREACSSGEFYRAWTAFKDERSAELPDLSEEGDGPEWVHGEAIPCEPVEEPVNNHTGRRVCFGPNSGTSMSGSSWRLVTRQWLDRKRKGNCVACVDVLTDDSELRKAAESGVIEPIRVKRSGPLRGILRNKHRCVSGEQEGLSAKEITEPSQEASQEVRQELSQGASQESSVVDDVSVVQKQLEMQLALQREISLLIAEAQKSTGQCRRVIGTKTFQEKIYGLKDIHRRMLEAHAEWVACLST